MSHVFQVELPEGNVVEVEAPENTPQETIRRRVYQHIFQHPEVSPTIAKQQGLNYQSAPDTSFDKIMSGDYMGATKQVGSDLWKAMNPPPDPQHPMSTGMEPVTIPGHPNVSSVLNTLKGAADTGIPGGAGLEGASIGEQVANSPVGSLLDRAKNLIQPKSSAVNAWMEVKPTSMVHGADPGAQILQEGLRAPTKQATLANVNGALQDAGTTLTGQLQEAGRNGIKINAEQHVINSLNDATKRIGKGSDSAFQGRLGNVLSDILQKYPELDNLDPEKAHALKVDIGDAIQWTGAPYEGDVNKALVDMYGRVNNELKTNVPDLADGMKRWGNLYQAQKSLKQSIINDAAGRGTGTAAPGSVKRVVKAAAPYAAGAAGAEAVYEAVKRLRQANQ